MVIQPEFSIPFQLTFHQYERQWEITQFSPDPEVQLENVPEVVENLDFSITFQSEHSDARLYMDGLEVLSEREGIELDDQHRPYLPPEDKPYVIFKNTEDYYPLIPGHYRITVIINGDTYYSLFRVIPKQLSQEQWELMRDELEAELRGLALDLVRKHLGVGEALFEYIPPKKLFQFLIIRKRFDSIMASLSDLMTRVYFHTQKHYNLVPVDRARAIDQESVRYKLTHPEVQDSLKSPIRRIEYDLLENRWIKRILKVLSRHLEDIASSLMQYRDALAEELNESLLYFSSSGSKIPVFLREKQRLLADLQSFVVMAQKNV